MNLFPFAIKNSIITSASNHPTPQKAAGIFTTIKIKNFIPLFLEMHLERVNLQDKKKLVQEQIKTLLGKNKISTCAVRISVLEKGDIFYHARELPQNNRISAITFVSSHSLPNVKQINRHIYQKAIEHALEHHAQEVIFAEHENILETTIGNIISIENGQLITPKLAAQGFKGITRQILLNSGKVVEKDIPVLADFPLVAVNCLRSMQIEKINHKKLPDSKILFQKVLHILQKAEENYANSYYR